MEIRNIAIIAHVDHGKTTLTDALMRQTGMTKEGVTMDSNALELERGITIYAKNTSVFYKGTKINIVDTPGHADFGSEVERVLRSIDTVLLLVDAQEGPMPQTRFVLKKSLELGLKPIVVLNKIDKPAARPKEVHDEVFELFFELGATDEQLDFTTVYAIGRQGIAKRTLEDESTNLDPLLDVVLEKVPAVKADIHAPMRMQPFNLGYDNFLGRLAIGRIYEGTIHAGESIIIKNVDGTSRQGKVTKLCTFEGTERKEVEEAVAGDIVMVAGLPDVYIGETLCVNAGQETLPAIKVDEPTISLNFFVNDSPFAGREGKFVTIRQIRDRLERELEVNVGLRVDFSANDSFKVYGRGEMHISILLEQMRREGFELKLEPYEELIIDVPSALSGGVIEKLNKRKAMMTNMKEENGITRLMFDIPTRGLLGYRGQFVVDTKGDGILSSRFVEFREHAGEIVKRAAGSMVSMASGKALGFSLYNLQDRGTLYIGPAVEVYEGQVIGNTSKGDEMTVNPTKGKQLSNMRSSGTDEAIVLTPPFDLSIERGLETMTEEEYLEITPKSVRLRKQYLTDANRVKAFRKN
ncbi:MAG: GTP-binding protein TypA/BipA [Parcubacteria group bacterium GW2011_GWC1_44_26]|nr:MAG: GTP-binding protein TypA/BipA [Parcubacteria group bacterium GW2011_GWC1_44_26]